ncbi:MAG TPA: class I SAM-dependent methyltransferase [Bacteroidia bacterium]|nr:class I SAM-dependent methyltransferase [Bacteroidia bacterium]
MDHSQFAASIFNKYAREYQEKFMDVSLYHESFTLFCNNLKKQNAEILELACGPGNITWYLLNSRPDLVITGTDLSPNMIELAKENNPQADFHVMDCRDISKITTPYDGIMAGFCFPYLNKTEAIKFIQDASKLLKSGGILYISTMEDDNHKSGLRKGSQGDELFMNFHEAGYLTTALTANNFTLIELQRILTHPPDGSTVVDLILIARRA